MTNPSPHTPATTEQIAKALATADGVLAAADRALNSADRAVSDATIAAAMRGEISFDQAVATGLETIAAGSPRVGGTTKNS